MVLYQAPELFRRQAIFTEGSAHELEGEVLEGIHTHGDCTEVHLQVEVGCSGAVGKVVGDVVLWVEDGLSHGIDDRGAVVLGRRFLDDSGLKLRQNNV